MKSAPITPARLAFADDGTPCAPDFNDVYHSAAGALAQAAHVFLGGNGLPGRWAGRERFVVLETGFGLGNNFLATWDAWRRDQQRCERLVFVSVEKHPLTRDDLARVHAASACADLARQLVADWPLPTPNLHLLDFEEGRVQLILAFGDVADMLPELHLAADAIYLDGFAPAKNAAMWSDDVLKQLARLAASGATAATWSAARAVRDGLARHGFSVSLAPGFAGKREMTVACHAPRYRAQAPAAFRPMPTGPREALVLGGGLAGCAAAWALSRQGWQATVLDRQPHPAQETSGNPGGLMHGIFNAPDSLHARWFRAAALHTARWAGPAVADGRIAGQLDGLLRLHARALDASGWSAEQRKLQAVGLPSAYVDLVDVDTAHRHTGVEVGTPGWWFANGGWLSPRDWCAEMLVQAGAAVRWRGQAHVARVARGPAGWAAFDAEGRCLAEAPVLVLAHGARSPGLVWPADAARLPLVATRGQTTVCPAGWAAVQPARAVAGNGYAIPLPDGRLLLGATTQAQDDAGPREADHCHNIERALTLGIARADTLAADAAPLEGRVGWRALTPDRLPAVGPLMSEEQRPTGGSSTRGRLRHVARLHDEQQGLYVLNGLASRGITSAALSGRLLAAWITGAPMPVEASLRDALDPARLDSR